MNGATRGIVMSNKYKTLQQWFADESRWHKGRCYRYDENVEIKSCCLYGAILHVYRDDPTRMLEVEEKIEKFVFNVGEGVSIPVFNDDPETTIEDIQRVVEQTDT